MGDYPPAHSAAGDQQVQQPTKDDLSNPNSNAAFQSQLEPLSQPQRQDSSTYGQPLNMGAMSQSLPPSPHSTINLHGPVGNDGYHSGMPPAHAMHHFQHGYQGGGPDHFAGVRAQQIPQMQYPYPPYAGLAHSPQQMRPMQLPSQFGSSDPYGGQPFGGAHQHSPPQGVDPRLMHSAAPGTTFPLMPGSHPGFAQYPQRTAEPAPVPSFPRGPPRKPKQSGHALWVGNLPPAARIEDLKDHFSRDATNDIESLFLISKSNCAFVNYRTEEACSDAMTRFHDSRFQGVRLVCRLRRSTGSSAAAAANEEETATEEGNKTKEKEAQDPESPVIVGGSSVSPAAEKPCAAGVGDEATQRAPDRYFIVKSLTVQDLESSTRTGIWATQNHNESLFNDAYEHADHVYLIFSANKSGEYFGYARMASKIAGQPVNLNAKTVADEPRTSGTPQAIVTPATETAPRGRIIDDSARGTIFWEAVRCEQDTVAPGEAEQDEEGNEATSGTNWGRQFQIAWISTTRLPFYRTRGLRNPWNSQREVKIARDGTELEPSIGRRLVAMFHGPAGPHHQGTGYR